MDRKCLFFLWLKQKKSETKQGVKIEYVNIDYILYYQKGMRQSKKIDLGSVRCVTQGCHLVALFLSKRIFRLFFFLKITLSLRALGQSCTYDECAHYSTSIKIFLFGFM